MRDIITKFFIFLINFLLISSCQANNFSSIDEIISDVKGSKKKKSKSPTKDSRPNKQKDIKISKDEKGNFQVSWKILKEYDLDSKEMGKNLKKIVNKDIAIKGFMIPLDYSEKKIKDFLLVPYMPSCAHVPPPPANAIISVTIKNKSQVKPSYYPVEVTGKIKVDQSESKKGDPYMPEAVYSLSATSINELKK